MVIQCSPGISCNLLEPWTISNELSECIVRQLVSWVNLLSSVLSLELTSMLNWFICPYSMFAETKSFDCKDEDVSLKLFDFSIWSIALLVVIFA